MGGDTTIFFLVFNLFHCSTKRTEAFNHQLVWVMPDLVWDSVYAANPAAPTLFLVVAPQHRPTSYLAVNLLTVIPDAGRRFKNFSTTFYSQHGLDVIAHLEVGRVILGASLEDPTLICGARLVSNGRAWLSNKLRLIWLCMICFCRKYLF